MKKIITFALLFAFMVMAAAAQPAYAGFTWGG